MTFISLHLTSLFPDRSDAWMAIIFIAIKAFKGFGDIYTGKKKLLNENSTIFTPNDQEKKIKGLKHK